jgi:glycosyltransferase involved in cell wall biosynthesis
LTTNKLKLVFLVGGYPTLDNPSHGIFNQRAVNSLRQHVELTLIHYRLFLPGRKIYEELIVDGYKHYILCVPFIPFKQRRFFNFNNYIFTIFTRFYASTILKQADLVHAGDGNQSVFAFRLKKHFRFKLIAQFIGGDLNQDLNGLEKMSWIPSWKKNLDAVTFNSKSLLLKYENLFGKHPLERVIYRGVNSDYFNPPRERPVGFKFYFLGGLPDYSTFKFGRNTKGGVHVMEAWSKIDKKLEYDKFLFTLNFAGPDSDMIIVQKWRSTLRKPDRVIIHGKINPNEVPKFHQQNNILLIPSLEEGLPNTAMEAASTGNLIIATKVGGLTEIVDHLENGILCTDTTDAALIEAIEYVFENPEIIHLYGMKARYKMIDSFNSALFGESYLALYNLIMNIK